MLRLLPQLFILLGSLTAIAAQASDLKPFTTDGCSAFPDGSIDDNAKWMECCIRHDFAYWKGGTLLQREQADAELQQCVSELGEEPLSVLMHVGVRLGGSPIFPMWYRWGYGWPYLRGYKELNAEEQQQIAQQLTVLRNLIDEFIEQSK